MIEPSNTELAELPECSRQYISDLEDRISALEKIAAQMYRELTEASNGQVTDGMREYGYYEAEK